MKTKRIEIELLAPKPRLRGFFKLVATKLDGSQRVLAEFENMITDVGLNQMGIADFRNICVVGTGSNVPVEVDTQLQTTTARTSTGAPSIPGATAQVSPPYYTQTNTGFRFAVGVAAGNLTEVGIGWSTGAGLTDYTLWARALIKDELDAPTTVTVLSDEVLDVYYAMRIYPPTVDEEYSIVISGVTHDCITRAAAVTSTQAWYVPSNRVLFLGLGSGSAQSGVFNGAIGLITGTPSGLNSYTYGSHISNQGYSNNSLVQDATYSWGLDQGNVSGYIKSILYQSRVGQYQTEFDPVIEKDATKVLSVAFRVGWARRP